VIFEKLLFILLSFLNAIYVFVYKELMGVVNLFSQRGAGPHEVTLASAGKY
jgi:hypothetical protein